MRSPITIRPPQSVAEMRDVWEVNARCWVEVYDHLLPDAALPDPGDPPDEDRLRERLAEATALNETGSGRYVVAVDESKAAADESDASPGDTGVVGFAATRWGDETKSFVGPDEAGLWVIYVDPSRWGAGIGSRLLADVTSAVPSRFDRVVLETFAENDVGRRFYRARGFSVVERTETDVGADTYPVVVMARSLDGR